MSAFSVRQARLDAGHSIRSLATELDMHPATLQRIEDGESAHPANVKKVADHFGVKVTDIIETEGAAA